MFHTRLKIFIGVWATALAVLVGRLVELQIVRSDYYRARAKEVLLLPPKALPFVRGRILDRTGQVLVSEEPSWDVQADYGLLAMDETYLARLVRRLRKEEHYGAGLSTDEVRQALMADLEKMWVDLSVFAGQPVEEIHQRVAAIRDRVRRIRDAVKRRRGFEAAVREERIPHAILSGLDDQEQVRARLRLVPAYPWLAVEDSTKRVFHRAIPIAHILGRMGPVDAEDIRDDPRREDDRAKYLPNELAGKSGVEVAAEQMLRGRRGRLRENLAGRVLEDIPAEDGQDVYLTLRADLQRRLYDAFGEYLATSPDTADATGGVVIVLDIPSREVLALVSYPSYEPSRFEEDYTELRADTLSTPLRFRAVANQYPPGSIAKPLACLAGLSSGRITLETVFTCTGYMFANERNRWRCWQVGGGWGRKAHGTINVVEAIEGSCNVFLYHVGEEVGVDYLTSFFDMFGIGRSTGIGLREEARGINPTPNWMARHHRPITNGTGRLLAIGQAELTVTPLQVANVFAQYASGIHKPVTLIKGLVAETPEWKLPGDPRDWDAVREGLYRVVNSKHGTANYYAYYDGEGYRICGKTGSATAPRRPLSYRVPYRDAAGNEAEVIMPAGSKSQAVGDFRRRYPDATFDMDAVVKHEAWPPDEDRKYAHAWFGGFLQPVDVDGQPMMHIKPRIAFVILVEFGGSGGRAAGPFAKQLVPLLMDTLGPALNPDGHPVPEVEPESDAEEAEVDE